MALKGIKVFVYQQLPRDIIDSYDAGVVIDEAPKTKIVRRTFTSDRFIDVTDYPESARSVLIWVLKHWDMNRKRLFATLEKQVVVILGESHHDFLKVIEDRVARRFVDYHQAILKLDLKLCDV